LQGIQSSQFYFILFFSYVTVIAGDEVVDQHCVIEYRDGVVTLHPIDDAICIVNRNVVSEPVKLTQGGFMVNVQCRYTQNSREII
jgi:hypothetical protein